MLLDPLWILALTSNLPEGGLRIDRLKLGLFGIKKPSRNVMSPRGSIDGQAGNLERRIIKLFFVGCHSLRLRLVYVGLLGTPARAQPLRPAIG